MTSFSNKLQQVSRRLQQLTVWRPTDRDPFDDLERWRTDAYRTIEEVYFHKRAQIERIIAKHEAEFMRQLVRQKSMLNNIRRRAAEKIPMGLTGHDQSGLTADLHRVESEIDTRLGRGEILVKTNPLQLDDSIVIHLKTYFLTSTLVTDMPKIDQRQKPVRRSVEEITRAYESWKRSKDDVYSRNRRKIQSATPQKLRGQKDQQYQCQKIQETSQHKETNGAFIKKKDIPYENNINQEALLT